MNTKKVYYFINRILLLLLKILLSLLDYFNQLSCHASHCFFFFFSIRQNFSNFSKMQQVNFSDDMIINSTVSKKDRNFFFFFCFNSLFKDMLCWDALLGFSSFFNIFFDPGIQCVVLAISHLF